MDVASTSIYASVAATWKRSVVFLWSQPQYNWYIVVNGVNQP